MAQSSGNIIDKKIPIGDIICFRVTGRYYNSRKRFRNDYNNLEQALMINLWKGSVWAIMKQGNWKLIKRVTN